MSPWSLYSLIYQPEASCDFPTPSQIKCPESEDYRRLITQITWQINNLTRGVKSIHPDFATAKLNIFIVRSFVNNKDLSFQLGYVVVLAY